MYFRRNRRGLYRILPVPKGILHTDHLSRENRRNTGKQTPSMARRHHHRNQRIKRTTQKRTNRSSNPAGKCRLQTQWKQIRIF